MAAVKFFMQFKNVQDDICAVSFIFEDYNGAPVELFGGPQPFVLGEYNTDDDLFKPMRPQQATIQVLASAGGVKLEDFLTDNDSDITVRFDFGGFGAYWYGILSQEDIEETWISTNHILTLRADEGFGRLQTQQLNDGNGAALIGTYTPYDFIQYATDGPLSFFRARIYSNLLHTSMSSASNQTGIDQCLIDARTFEQAPGQFDNAYTVIEKINRAWNQTLFQYDAQWVILRIPEMFTDGNLIGFNTNRPTVGNRQAVNKRYDIEVGVQEDVKPIAPEMLKTVVKPSKYSQVNFDWVPHNQLISNQSFEYGEYVNSGTKTETDGAGSSISINYDNYTVNNWLLYYFQNNTVHTRGSLHTGVPYGRRVEYNAQGLRNNYLYIGGSGVSIPPGALGVNGSEAFSSVFYIKWNDILSYSVNFRLWQNIERNQPLTYARIFLKNGIETYYLDWFTDKWKPLIPGADTGHKVLYPVGSGFLSNEWSNLSIGAKNGAPIDGYVEFTLVNSFNFWFDTVQDYMEVHFSDLTIEITNSISLQRNRVIKGDYDRYTIENNVVKTQTDTVYLDDAQTQNHKGAILEDDGITLTGDQWFRRTDFNGDVATSERLTFKRQNALARWYMNRSYKTKLDVNMFGLKWTDITDVVYPIGLINTIKFVDDAPNKIFAIANLKQIDFMSCTWNATLMEVFDTTVEDNEPGDTDVHTFDYYYE
jgi:hypothetical protein